MGHPKMFKQIIVEEQIKAASKVIRSGNLSSLHGNEVALFEDEVAKKLGVRNAVAVNSGTAALHLALLSMNIGEGDEVILPALTFIATLNAVKMTGATPVIIDVEKGTYAMDPTEFKLAITHKTKAVIPVHLASIPAQMDAIMEIAELNHIEVIEDACQAFGSKWNDQYVGTIGKIGCFSFYPSKIITTGEGGMIVTNNNHIAATCLELRSHGMAVNIAYNYRMTEVAGALGVVGMKYFDKIKEHNKMIYEMIATTTLWLPPLIPSKADIAPTYIPLRYPKLDEMNFYQPLAQLPHSVEAYNRTKKVRLN